MRKSQWKRKELLEVFENCVYIVGLKTLDEQADYHYNNKYLVKRDRRKWLSGRALASQAEGRGFESRLPLQLKNVLPV